MRYWESKESNPSPQYRVVIIKVVNINARGVRRELINVIGVKS